MNIYAYSIYLIYKMISVYSKKFYSCYTMNIWNVSMLHKCWLIIVWLITYWFTDIKGIIVTEKYIYNCIHIFININSFLKDNTCVHFKFEFKYFYIHFMTEEKKDSNSLCVYSWGGIKVRETIIFLYRLIIEDQVICVFLMQYK